MEHDCSGLKQGEIVLLVGRDLPEGMQSQVRGLLHCRKRDKANLVRLAHFLQRPTYARITRQSLAAVRRAFEGSNGDRHMEAPCRRTRTAEHRGRGAF